MANFKTRARTLDLLGRQQIAGIPSAINELLKNAHDAYADNVDIDYFRLNDLFVLRDDGIGMSREDFETRWLTLGTESKVSHRNENLPPIDTTKPARIAMGEKGIGRLAIASIGKQVLIVTKPKHQKNITVAFINWQVFELPELNLEDIVIPVMSLESLPSSVHIEQMKCELISSLDNLLIKNNISQEEYDSIQNTIESFHISPIEFNESLVGNFSLKDIENGGTYFYISGIDETLNDDVDGIKSEKEATKIEKMLMGFHNTMTPDHPEPLLNIVFRDYRLNDGTYLDVMDKEHFFTQEDFEVADHHIKGVFDEFGQFKGMIKVYKEKTFDHIVNWNSNHFNPTKCGAFEINFAYIQGDKSDTVMNSEDYSRVKAKADKFGGLYVYKDNIRILPYGDSDYDFLDIEKKRSRRAATAFFSYRRMFGVINLSQLKNLDLKEKAGREGFIENKAYRQLVQILKNFFDQLAADFFREDNSAGPKAEVWAQKRQELNTSHKALQKREKQARTKILKFEENLKSFFENIESSWVTSKIDYILDEAQQDFNRLYSLQNLDQASQEIIDIEAQTRQKLYELRQSLLVAIPRGFTVKQSLKLDYQSYLEMLESLDSTVFLSAESKLDTYVQKTISVLNISINKRKRIEQAVEAVSQEALKINKQKKKSAHEHVEVINKKVKILTNELMIDLDNQIRNVKDQFKTLATLNESDIDLVKKRNELSDEIQSVSLRNTQLLDTVIRQLEGIGWEKDENNHYITPEEMTDALSEEVEGLREKMHTDVELSQLGLAVSVIQHEFNSTTRSIRSSLKDLRAWSDVNEELETVYKNIKINFEHLDGYLNLFTPLNRRLNRKNETIKLMEIKHFLIDLFSSRFERHGISFKHTKGFKQGQIIGFRSSFYPVFVNVIDNAIHWLNESQTEDKIIRLHADSEGNVYISNNGVPISIQDKNKIFHLGFTRKENGRGMGLHISNEALKIAGYQLLLSDSRQESTVTFKLSKKEK